MFRGKNLLLVLMIVALSIFNTNLAVWAEANDFSVQATFNMTALVPGKVLSVKFRSKYHIMLALLRGMKAKSGFISLKMEIQ